MSNKKLFIILFVLILIIITIMAFVFYNKPKISENNQTYSNQPKIIPANELIGTWNAISEEVKGEIYKDLEDYSITFNKDTYVSNKAGIEESGNYKLEKDKITFYSEGEDITKQGSFLQAYGELKDNQLILNFPQYPKTVIYEKEN